MLADFLINVFNRGAMGSRRVRIALTSVGPVFFLGLIVFLIGVSLYLDKSLGFGGWLSLPLRLPISVLLSGSGTFLVVWSVTNFFMAKGTPVPFNPPPVLVDTGPYARSRNPMLAGVFLILFGTGVFLKSISLTFLVTPLFILVMVLELKTVEEPELVRRLGEEYVTYRQRVPMFFPGIRKKTKPGQFI